MREKRTVHSQVSLDDPASYSHVDPGNMYRRAEQLPAYIADGWRLVGALNLPADYRSVQSVVVAGMGGSALAGSLVASYGAAEIPVPLTLWRDYSVPGFVGRDTLVICITHSGNTEETLSALEGAWDRGAKLLVITAGGKAKEIATDRHIPLITFSDEPQPRSYIGYLFVPLLWAFQQLGFLGSQREALQEAIQVLQSVGAAWASHQPTGQNPAKQMAVALRYKTAVVYGGDYLAGVALRWKNQINEDSKHWSFCEALPEVNHNSIVGYEYPPAIGKATYVVILSGSHLADRMRQRIALTEKLLKRFGVEFRTVSGEGQSRLAQMLSLISLGDYVSYYLALLNGTDPWRLEAINVVKGRLSADG